MTNVCIEKLQIEIHECKQTNEDDYVMSESDESEDELFDQVGVASELLTDAGTETRETEKECIPALELQMCETASQTRLQEFVVKNNNYTDIENLMDAAYPRPRHYKKRFRLSSTSFNCFGHQF